MNEYEDQWAKDEPAVAPKAEPEAEMPAPATNAVRSAYEQARDEDAKAFSDAFNATDISSESDDGSASKSMSVTKDQIKAEPMEEPKQDPKPMKFGDAFKAAKAEGKKVFDFNGKKYTTDLARATKAKPVVKAPEVAAEPEVKPAAPAAKEDKSIYDDNTFPKNVINAVKSKMGDKANVSKTLPNGKPNLTAA